jgi:hypothetical protein
MSADRTFLTDGRPYLNTRQAALYVGYEPDESKSHRRDPQIRAFYEWCRRRGVQQQPGRAVWKRADLEAGVARQVPSGDEDGLDAMREMAHRDWQTKFGPRLAGQGR